MKNYIVVRQAVTPFGCLSTILATRESEEEAVNLVDELITEMMTEDSSIAVRHLSLFDGSIIQRIGWLSSSAEILYPMGQFLIVSS